MSQIQIHMFLFNVAQQSFTIDLHWMGLDIPIEEPVGPTFKMISIAISKGHLSVLNHKATKQKKNLLQVLIVTYIPTYDD